MRDLKDSLRADTSEIKRTVGDIDTRVQSLERKVLRAVYGVGGVLGTITILWVLIQAATTFFDISITPKASEPAAAQQPVSPKS